MSSGKSVLLIIASYNFRDEEYKGVSEKLLQADIAITVASTTTEPVSGSQGIRVKPDILIDDADPEQFDAVVFIGGTGSSQYWHDTKAHEIILSLNSKNKPVAASSHAVVTLAVAGVLKNRKATAHISVYEKLSVQGAVYTAQKLEIDGNIITSAGVNAAKEFSEAVVQALTAELSAA